MRPVPALATLVARLMKFLANAAKQHAEKKGYSKLGSVLKHLVKSVFFFPSVACCFFSARCFTAFAKDFINLPGSQSSQGGDWSDDDGVVSARRVRSRALESRPQPGTLLQDDSLVVHKPLPEHN